MDTSMRFSGKKCLVTGGAGFIGSRIVNTLIAEGAEVISIDNLLSGNIYNVNPKAKFFNMDITRELMNPLFEGIDYVFHTAAMINVPICLLHPIETYQVNVMGSLNVLKAARQAKVKKVVLSSSCIVYSGNTPYKTSKVAMEELAKCYRKYYEVPSASLRYSNVYGKGQSESGQFPNVIAAMKKSKRENGEILVTGTGEQTRDFIHVDDIVEANLIFALNDFQGEIDICTGIQTSINDVAKMFDCPIKYTEDRKGDAKNIIQNPEPALEKGFSAKIKLTDGIKEVL